MLIKKKSLVVALVSSIVIALVMILTLAGYFIYLELKAEEFKLRYQELLGRAKAKIYSKHIEIKELEAKIENTGALKGQPVIEGSVKNTGSRQVFNLAININFLDADGAAIYEAQVHPQEPSLGNYAFARVSIPYLYTPPRTILHPGETCRFKKIVPDCPTEIFLDLREGDKPKKNFGRWSGTLASKVASLDF